MKGIPVKRPTLLLAASASLLLVPPSHAQSQYPAPLSDSNILSVVPLDGPPGELGTASKPSAVPRNNAPALVRKPIVGSPAIGAVTPVLPAKPIVPSMPLRAALPASYSITPQYGGTTPAFSYSGAFPAAAYYYPTHYQPAASYAVSGSTPSVYMPVVTRPAPLETSGYASVETVLSTAPRLPLQTNAPLYEDSVLQTTVVTEETVTQTRDAGVDSDFRYDQTREK